MEIQLYVKLLFDLLAFNKTCLCLNIFLELYIYLLTQFQIALAYLERGIDIRPEHTELLVLKCRCLVEMSRFK